MSAATRLAGIAPLRRAALSALWLARDVDVTIRHPWAPGARMRLNLFRHKGYWFQRRAREATTMAAFARLLRPGDVAFDVGAHVGWLAVQFAHLVGAGGRVVAFEPGANNLPYLHRNLAAFAQARIVEAAVGAAAGTAALYEESLTGQNNALAAPYHRLQANAALNPAALAVTARPVRVTTLDEAAAEAGDPALVKIDVEGHELAVLQGGAAMLARARPVLMIEVTRDRAAIAEMLGALGYRLFQVAGPEIRPLADPASMHFNVFAWPGRRDPALLLAAGDEHGAMR